MVTEQNPYAPPNAQTSPQTHDEWLKGIVWRDRDKMVIGRNAELPPRCFLTGEDTDCSVEIRATWPPAWSLRGLLLHPPQYFYTRRDVKLKVPIAQQVFRDHLRLTRFASKLTLLFAIALVVGFGQLTLSSFVWLAPACGILFVMVIIGFLFASTDPLQLHVENLTNDTLVLGRIHPRCLENLPDIREAQLRQ